jgi:chromosome segregation ATPase
VSDSEKVVIPLRDLAVEELARRLIETLSQRPSDVERQLNRLLSALESQQTLTRTMLNEHDSERHRRHDQDVRITQLEANYAAMRSQVGELQESFASLDEFTAVLRKDHERLAEDSRDRD